MDADPGIKSSPGIGRSRGQKHVPIHHRQFLVASSWVGSIFFTFAWTQYACMSCGDFDAAVALHALQKCSLRQRSCPTVWVWAGLMLKLCVGWREKRASSIACLAPVFSCRIVLIQKLTIRRVLILLRIVQLLSEMGHTHLVHPHAL